MAWDLFGDGKYKEAPKVCVFFRYEGRAGTMETSQISRYTSLDGGLNIFVTPTVLGEDFHFD